MSLGFVDFHLWRRSSNCLHVTRLQREDDADERKPQKHIVISFDKPVSSIASERERERREHDLKAPKRRRRRPN